MRAQLRSTIAGMGRGIRGQCAVVAAATAGVCAVASFAGAALTPTEAAWLDLGAPVLRYAIEQRLPLDISVQPSAQPGDPPLALGYHEGRCKLVLSMRGNPAAQATLDALEPGLRAGAVEAMTAHELGHCWRYVRGEWHRAPAGFTATPSADGADDARREMEATRREEGYADLVGLAWTARAHPADYARLHAWMSRLREREPVAGGHHDTRAWLRLAGTAQSFDPRASPFEAALPLWRRGLEADQ
jgi:hypothetical protein